MTHNADCTVTERGGEKLSRIGSCFSNATDTEELEQCQAMAADAGLDRLGEGAARAVYEADPETAEGVEAEKCVVKFAKSSTLSQDDEIGNGQLQNEAEVRDWGAVPARIRNRFLPIRDWDDEYTWITTPKAEEAGNWHAVQAIYRDLLDADWFCYDVHPENIGEMHDRLRILDYGLECMELDEVENDGAIEEARHLVGKDHPLQPTM